MRAEPRYDAGSPPKVMFAGITATFAAFLLMIASLFDILQGASAVAHDELYTATEYLYEIDLTAWGWIHIGVGAIGVAVAVGIFCQTAWAQVAGLTVASLGILTNFAFLPIYPVWSAFIIGFNVLFVWALWVQLDLAPGPDGRSDPVAGLKHDQDEE